MPVTLSQIAANTATVVIQATPADSVVVEYYPGRVTEKAVAVLSNLSRLNSDTVLAGFASFNEQLAHLIKSWDVMDDTVTPPAMFPIDATRFAELPFAFRVQVFSAIMGAFSPNALTGLPTAPTPNA